MGCFSVAVADADRVAVQSVVGVVAADAGGVVEGLAEADGAESSGVGAVAA